MVEQLVDSRVAAQRAYRDVGCVRSDPPTPPALMQEIERNARSISTYSLECVCGCPIVTRVTQFSCPSCGRQIELLR